MRRGVDQIIADAINRSYEVTQDGNVVHVFKNKDTGLTFWPDGTATRADVDLVVCKAIRTIKEMRRALEL